MLQSEILTLAIWESAPNMQEMVKNYPWSQWHREAISDYGKIPR